MAFPLDGTKQQGATAKRTVPQITLHTSENAPGTRNAALANFIRTRSDYGSYHCIADTTGAELQLAGFRSKVWHCPVVNDFAMGLSAVTRASDWNALSDRARKALVNGLAKAASRYSRWCVAQGVGPVQPRRLTRSQALQGLSGFCTHGELQPQDRSDPGADFPWKEFMAAFKALEAGKLAPAVTAPEKEKPLSLASEDIKRIESVIWGNKDHDLNGNKNSKSFAVQNTNDQVNHLRKEVAALRGTLKGLVEELDKTYSGLQEHVTEETDRAVAEITENKES